MEYDLIRLFDHDVNLFDYIAPAIVAFGSQGSDACTVSVDWKRSADEDSGHFTLTLKWAFAALRLRNSLIDRQIRMVRENDDAIGRRTEVSAIVMAAAVMAYIEPETKFTRVAAIGTRHDFYLNHNRDEMIEIAGRTSGGLSSLFEEKREQSDLQPILRKRWVSVTVLRTRPRNRTEGLHP